MKYVRTTQADPYSFARLYSREEKYRLQNMEVKSVNFMDLVEECKIHDVYDDRIHTEWRQAAATVQSAESGDAFWHGVSDNDFLAFASRIAEHCGFSHPVTGARIVRFTDGGGYPVYRLDMINGGKRDAVARYRDYEWRCGSV